MLAWLCYRWQSHLRQTESERRLFGSRSFIGLWEGIDPVDGGDSLRSITCSPDRSCELAATDSVITLCGGGAGFAGGTGGFEGDKLVFPDAVLTCPNGTTVNLAIRYERDPLNRTLVETTVVLDTDTILPTSSSTRSAGKPRELSIPSSVRAPAARR